MTVAGLLGLFVASFVAAYMSTVDTQLNWGSSYLVNDFYRRFLVRGRPDGHYVVAARLFTLVLGPGAVGMLALVAMLVTDFHLRDFSAAFLGALIVSVTGWVSSRYVGSRGLEVEFTEYRERR